MVLQWISWPVLDFAFFACGFRLLGGGFRGFRGFRLLAGPLSEAITKIGMNTDSHYPRRKCSAETLVCNDIRVMPIFVGVRWIGASDESSVVEKCRFCFLWSLYLSKFHV